MYKNRDLGINHIMARKNCIASGMGLGIMLLDDIYPAFPGDVRNPSAFSYPIQYEIAEGVDNYTLLWAEDKSPCLEPIKRAAKKLERMGCRAIAAECGYFSYFQQDIAGYVDVPVLMSSLLQVPFAQQLIGANKSVGIMYAHKKFLTDDHLKNVGIDPDSNLEIVGVQDEYECPQFDLLWNPEKRSEVPQCYFDEAQKDMVKISKDFYKSNPHVGAILLECTGFQPFARAIQREVDLPIFSWGTLLDYAYSVVAHREYYGHI